MNKKEKCFEELKLHGFVYNGIRPDGLIEFVHYDASSTYTFRDEEKEYDKILSSAKNGNLDKFLETEVELLNKMEY